MHLNADVTSGMRAAIERPGMKKLLEYADEKDTVVVWRVDRLGRSLIDVLNTVNMLRDRGILIRSVSDVIDPATSTGRLVGWSRATLYRHQQALAITAPPPFVTPEPSLPTTTGR
jgi:DNA invertase Pin-like site-specific DNA recombinase